MLFNWPSTEFFNIITILAKLKYDANSSLPNAKYPTSRQQGLNNFTESLVGQQVLVCVTCFSSSV